LVKFSEIVIEPVLSAPFQEIGYIVSRENGTNCFVVDPGLEPENFLEVFDQKKLNPIAILVTHGHADHIGGITKIRNNWIDCKIYVGEDDAKKLVDAEENLSANFGLSVTVPAADFMLQDGEQLELAGIPLEVRHTPGHSKGHVVYLIPAEPRQILFAGDAIFRCSIGRSDFPDSNPQIQIPAIRSKILSLPEDTLIYPGHGLQTTVRNERQNNPFL
jgi:glyoxylase-like metal-dependent hydrolase (beta-lactamase superfamily II)